MQKTIRIFGYGSLINEESLRRTVPNAFNLFPAKVKGFVRVFNLPTQRKRCSEKGCPIAVLNIEKSEWNQEINGLCFEMNVEEFDALQERERSYELIEIEIEDYEGNLHKGFTFRVLHYDAYPYIFGSSTQDEYMQICIEGCKTFGDEFLEDFMKTTYIGNKTLEEIKEEIFA